MGCVIIQYCNTIACASRKLKAYGKYYPTHDLELGAVIFFINIWTHYFHGVHVNVFTDHKSLQDVFTLKDKNLHQRLWLELLKDYDISVLYHLSKGNVVADALSRLSIGSVKHIDD